MLSCGSPRQRPTNGTAEAIHARYNSSVNNSLDSYPSKAEARQAVYRTLEASFAEGRRPVLIVSSHERALSERRCLAQASAGFGVEALTLAQWVANLAQLHARGLEGHVLARGGADLLRGRLLPQAPGRGKIGLKRLTSD